MVFKQLKELIISPYEGYEITEHLLEEDRKKLADGLGKFLKSLKNFFGEPDQMEVTKDDIQKLIEYFRGYPSQRDNFIKGLRLSTELHPARLERILQRLLEKIS